MKRLQLTVLLCLSSLFMMASERTTDEPGGIAKIKRIWRMSTIKVNAGTTTPRIHDFALAFSKQFPEFEPNRVLGRYVTSPKDFSLYYEGAYQISDLSEYTFTYYLKDSPRLGFMTCEASIQFDYRTQCCYWKRKNGHRLVAFYMAESYEDSSCDDQLIAFYDYDPKTDTMKPETKLTDMVEKQVEGFDWWSITLPEEGKDVRIAAFCQLDEEDSVEDQYFLMKWDGQNFKMLMLESEGDEDGCGEDCDH